MEVKPSEIEVGAKIKVVGVGGGGGSSINRMINNHLEGVQFIAINTDAQALHHNLAPIKIHIGKQLTKGLGAGANPDIGRRAAEENSDEIYENLKDSDMIFITCGLGGGTGTGASPVIAEIAKETDALTVAVVTLPFSFEGFQRQENAQRGLKELKEKVDAIIVIPNDRIFQQIDKKTSIQDAFRIVDDVLFQGVQGISDLIVVPGMINLDFADVKTIMSNAGSALMGIGISTGENRAVEAAKAALESPLLDLSIEGATGILFNVMGGPDLTMPEIKEAADLINSAADPQANIIWGVSQDDSKQGQVKIVLIATGFKEQKQSQIQQDFSTTRKTQNYQQQIQSKSPIYGIGKNTNSQLSNSQEDIDDSYSIPAYLREKVD